MFTKLYYHLKPFVPPRFLLSLRQWNCRRKWSRYRHVWPILANAGAPPAGWPGWPDNKRFALILTHDVDSITGQENCPALMELEERCGFRSGFYFVPEKYPLDHDLLRQVPARGFELGLHGLRHDGFLYASREIFNRRARRINRYLHRWRAVGFRSPSMHHVLDWLGQLDIEYDCSTADIDPFEPQPLMLGTIWPCTIPCPRGTGSFVELPYTLPQDFTLFGMLGESSIAVWKAKLDWIAERGGMALLLTHPDYMDRQANRPNGGRYPMAWYEEFLRYVQDRYAGQYWHALPRDAARFWRRSGAANANWYCPHQRRPSSAAVPVRFDRCKPNQRPRPARRPLRVCMVAYTFYEWDNRVKRYAEALARRGDAVDVIALKHGHTPYHERINGVNVHRIQKRLVNEKNRLSYLYRLTLFLAKSAWCLLAMHLRRPYDVIHVHTVPDFEVFAAFLPKCLGAKVILDLHELSPELYLSKFRSDQDSAIYRRMIQVEKASVSFADYVIIVNDFCQKTLLARSPCQRKCTVFLNYPDPTIFHPRPRQPDRGNHECRLLYPGTLNWHQGLDVAIRAFARIRDAAGQAHFYIYGQGPERSRLEALIRQLSLENRVHILPMQPIEAIAGIMAQSDIGVVPKRKDSFGNEAISTKIFEFMSLGVPVVAADTRIDTHYFSDATIQFFRSGDEQDLADKLLDLIRNRRKRNRLAREAQRFVQRYSWRWHRDRYLALIDRLSGRAATGGTAEPDGPSGPAP